MFAAKVAKKDPSEAVIDEVVGMGISLLFVPKSIALYIVAFLLFRFFDITKIYPIKKFEKLPGGWGIMLDDVVAGIFSLGVLQGFIVISRCFL